MCKIEAHNLVELTKKIRLEYDGRLLRKGLERAENIDEDEFHDRAIQICGVFNHHTSREPAVRAYLDILTDHDHQENVIKVGGEPEALQPRYGSLYFDYREELYRASGRLYIDLPILIWGMFKMMILMPWIGLRFLRTDKEMQSKYNLNNTMHGENGSRLGGVWIIKNNNRMALKQLQEGIEGKEGGNQGAEVVFRHIENTFGDISEPDELESVIRSVLDQYLDEGEDGLERGYPSP